ncbi:DinB family protein [Chitinophaga sp. YIM B06452]|uniref:DinB family protein n=1 Tax=Chitinophaga sp. YIM B06452 TaxID=3082158 RepID=UPI0031FE9302
MKEIPTIIKNLKELLHGGHAHATFEQAVKDLPASLRGQVPEGMPYSIWQLVEHIRITQLDILEFSRDPGYKSPEWPEGYWPKEHAPVNANAWEESITQIATDRKAFIELLEAPGADLFTPFQHGTGQNLLREAMLIADHTSYHTGEIIVLRRLMGAWK